MQFQFRDSKEIDYGQLLQLQRTASWSRHCSLKQLKRAVTNSHLLLTGWKEEKLVACARVLMDYIYRAVAFDLIVHPDFQRLGLGRELMRQVVEQSTLKEVEYSTRDSDGKGIAERASD